MSSNKHRAEYETRVNRVLDYIREHKSEELTLETLARVAAFSPFHFHRIFKAMTGENVKELVQRTRLESAASQLVYAQEDILAVALDHGFRSASAFARAFKERFGVTASEWRAGAWRLRKSWLSDGKPSTADGKGGEAAGDAAAQDGSTTGDDAGYEEIAMDVTVKNLPSYHVAYLRNVGPYGADGGIPELWLKLARWAGVRDLWTPDRICIGTAIDDPMVTEPAKCRYDAAIVVPAGFEPEGGVNVTDVPGGKHAVGAVRRQLARHRHGLEDSLRALAAGERVPAGGAVLRALPGRVVGREERPVPLRALHPGQAAVTTYRVSSVAAPIVSRADRPRGAGSGGAGGPGQRGRRPGTRWR